MWAEEADNPAHGVLPLVAIAERLLRTKPLSCLVIFVDRGGGANWCTKEGAGYSLGLKATGLPFLPSPLEPCVHSPPGLWGFSSSHTGMCYRLAMVPGDWRPHRPAREGCSEPGSVFWFPVQPLQLRHPGSVSCKDETASRTLTARVRLWALASRAWLGSVGNSTVREKICSIKGCFPGAAISNASSTFFFFLSNLYSWSNIWKSGKRSVLSSKNQFVQQIERDTVSHYQSKQISTGLSLPPFAEPINCQKSEVNFPLHYF